MRIRIQQLKLMQIHADPDPKPWNKGSNIIMSTDVSITRKNEVYFTTQIRKDRYTKTGLEHSFSDLQPALWIGNV